MEVDTTFGLAYYKLALTRGWLVGTQDSTGQVAIDRALLYSQKLPAHDRAVITAYRFFLLGQNAASRNIYQQLLAKNPGDADAWYGLGDAWFHDTRGGTDRHYTESLRAFRRTLALAPDYALAYEHVQYMLNVASRPGTGVFLVTSDSFAMAGAWTAVRLRPPRPVRDWQGWNRPAPGVPPSRPRGAPTSPWSMRSWPTSSIPTHWRRWRGSGPPTRRIRRCRFSKPGSGLRAARARGPRPIEIGDGHHHAGRFCGSGRRPDRDGRRPRRGEYFAYYGDL